MTRDPAWRDEAAARLAANEAARLKTSGRVLIVDDPSDEVAEAAAGAGAAVERWDRMARPGRTAAAWPDGDSFSLVAIRLPKSKPALELTFDAVLPRITPGGRVLLYGAKDEGIRSATGRIESVTGVWTTRATGGHARLLEWIRPPDFECPWETSGNPDHLSNTIPLDPGGGLRDWRVWPGVFGTAGIDPGTALLLKHLPEPQGRIVDFGAGTGVLAAGMVDAGAKPNDLTMIEPDALAARAAVHNVPGARIEIVAGWPELGEVGTVVSNPPYHEGKVESVSIIEDLVRGAARDLRKGGELRLVVQRRLPLEGMLRAHFSSVSTIADTGAFRIWSGTVN